VTGQHRVRNELLAAVIAVVAASALWLPRPLRRSVGAPLALLVALFSIARGVSGSLSSEGGVWVHILLGLSGLPLALVAGFMLSRPEREWASVAN